MKARVQLRFLALQMAWVPEKLNIELVGFCQTTEISASESRSGAMQLADSHSGASRQP